MLKIRVISLFAPLVFLAAAAYAGAPLKGVDVKLGKNPGGGAAARATSDDQGKVDFGVLPAGAYSMTLHKGDGQADVEVTGAGKSTIRRRWDFSKSMAYEVEANAKAAGQPQIEVHSDGKHPLQATIVKSKSNISNN